MGQSTELGQEVVTTIKFSSFAEERVATLLLDGETQDFRDDGAPMGGLRQQMTIRIEGEASQVAEARRLIVIALGLGNGLAKT